MNETLKLELLKDFAVQEGYNEKKIDRVISNLTPQEKLEITKSYFYFIKKMV